MTDDLERRLREVAKDRAQMERDTPGAYPRPPRQHIEWQAADEIARLRAETARLRQEVVAFGGLWAVQYAKDHGLAEGELHPAHYDILAKAGGRMDNYRPAALQEGSRHE